MWTTQASRRVAETSRSGPVTQVSVAFSMASPQKGPVIPVGRVLAQHRGGVRRVAPGPGTGVLRFLNSSSRDGRVQPAPGRAAAGGAPSRAGGAGSGRGRRQYS